MVKYLLDRGLNPNNRNDNGETGLLFALHGTPTPELIQLLINYGADPQIPDNSGVTPFIFVSEWNHRMRQFPLKEVIMEILESFEEEPIKVPEEE